MKCAAIYGLVAAMLRSTSAQCNVANSVPGFTLIATDKKCASNQGFTSTGNADSHSGAQTMFNIGNPGQRQTTYAHGQNFAPVCKSPIGGVDYWSGSDHSVTQFPDIFDVQSDSTNLYITRIDSVNAWTSNLDLALSCLVGSTPVRTAHMLTAPSDKVASTYGDFDHSGNPLNRCIADCDDDNDCAGDLQCHQCFGESGNPCQSIPGCTGPFSTGGTGNAYGSDYCFHGKADSVPRANSWLLGLVHGNIVNTRACAHFCSITDDCEYFTIHTGIGGQEYDQTELCELTSDCANQIGSTAISQHAPPYNPSPVTYDMTGFVFRNDKIQTPSTAQTCSGDGMLGMCFDWAGVGSAYNPVPVTSTQCGVGKVPGEAAGLTGDATKSIYYTATKPTAGIATSHCVDKPCGHATDIAACCDVLQCGDKTGDGSTTAVTDSECGLGYIGPVSEGKQNVLCNQGVAAGTACDVSTIGAADHVVCCTGMLCTAAAGHASVVITTGSSLQCGALDYTVVCADGYGNADPTPFCCSSAGTNYGYAQCTTLACTSPHGNSGATPYVPASDPSVEITETQLDGVTGFDVTLECTPGYEGTPTATRCTANGHYTHTSCARPEAPAQKLVWPPPPGSPGQGPSEESTAKPEFWPPPPTLAPVTKPPVPAPTPPISTATPGTVVQAVSLVPFTAGMTSVVFGSGFSFSMGSIANVNVGQLITLVGSDGATFTSTITAVGKDGRVTFADPIVNAFSAGVTIEFSASSVTLHHQKGGNVVIPSSVAAVGASSAPIYHAAATHPNPSQLIGNGGKEGTGGKEGKERKEGKEGKDGKERKIGKDGKGTKKSNKAVETQEQELYPARQSGNTPKGTAKTVKQHRAKSTKIAKSGKGDGKTSAKESKTEISYSAVKDSQLSLGSVDATYYTRKASLTGMLMIAAIVALLVGVSALMVSRRDVNRVTDLTRGSFNVAQSEWQLQEARDARLPLIGGGLTLYNAPQRDVQSLNYLSPRRRGNATPSRSGSAHMEPPNSPKNYAYL